MSTNPASSGNKLLAEAIRQNVPMQTFTDEEDIVVPTTDFMTILCSTFNTHAKAYVFATPEARSIYKPLLDSGKDTAAPALPPDLKKAVLIEAFQRCKTKLPPGENRVTFIARLLGSGDVLLKDFGRSLLSALLSAAQGTTSEFDARDCIFSSSITNAETHLFYPFIKQLEPTRSMYNRFFYKHHPRSEPPPTEEHLKVMLEHLTDKGQWPEPTNAFVAHKLIALLKELATRIDPDSSLSRALASHLKSDERDLFLLDPIMLFFFGENVIRPILSRENETPKARLLARPLLQFFFDSESRLDPATVLKETSALARELKDWPQLHLPMKVDSVSLKSLCKLIDDYAGDGPNHLTPSEFELSLKQAMSLDRFHVVAQVLCGALGPIFGLNYPWTGPRVQYTDFRGDRGPLVRRLIMKYTTAWLLDRCVLHDQPTNAYFHTLITTINREVLGTVSYGQAIIQKLKEASPLPEGLSDSLEGPSMTYLMLPRIQLRTAPPSPEKEQLTAVLPLLPASPFSISPGQQPNTGNRFHAVLNFIAMEIEHTSSIIPRQVFARTLIEDILTGRTDSLVDEEYDATHTIEQFIERVSRDPLVSAILKYRFGPSVKAASRSRYKDLFLPASLLAA